MDNSSDPETRPTVLIVEDEDNVASYIEEVLIQSGYDVVGISVSGARAIIMVEENNPDLVLMDIDLEGEMDGVETSDFIQKRFGSPVIFLTGHDEKEMVEKAHNTLPFGYVLKPFRARDLQITLEMALLKVRVESERREAENALRKSEENYRMLFEAASDAIVLVDVETLRLVDGNDRATELYGYTYDELLQLKVTDLSAEPEKTRDVFRDETVNSVFLRNHRKKDGTVFPVEVKASIFDYNNKRIHLSSIRDISKRIVFEDEKRKLEMQLMQSQKMEAIGQLAAGVAHEINNPIGFISSNLNSLKDYTEQIGTLVNHFLQLESLINENNSEMLSDKLGEQIQHITSCKEEIEYEYISDDIPDLINDCIEGSKHIARIVSDLKTFAHPGEDKQVFVDINEGLQTTLNVVHNELKYKATVITEFGDIPRVKGYPQKLNQVFMNILVNAAQAMEEMGEIRVITSTIGKAVIITISDTGSGIEEKHLATIFDPFFTTKEVGKGTGLGMSISYSIIEEHQGRITVESTVGQGTTFTILLPVEE